MEIVLVLSIVLVLVFSQVPPPWGGNRVFSVEVLVETDDPLFSWNFKYSYDWNIKAQRYQHFQPQFDQFCNMAQTKFNKNKFDCIVTFSKDGWSYIQFPTKNYCCKCSNSFGPIRYDWLYTNSTYIGIQTIDNVAVTHWTKSGQFSNHYYSTVDKALPVKFLQIKRGHPKSWDFNLKTYTTAPIDPQVFSSKCQNKCSGPCSTLISFQKLV